jgi:hypothetical protein
MGKAPAAKREQWINPTDGGYRMTMKSLKTYLEGRDLPY